MKFLIQDDGTCQPVNYSGTQVNIFGQPNADSLNSILGNPAGGVGGYPYGMAYPQAGYTNNIQLGLMTEHMLRVTYLGLKLKAWVDTL